MISSSKPRKQRLYRFTAPLHERQHFVNSHVDKQLRARLGIKRRAIRIASGDTVRVMSGGKKGTTGKVVAVDLRSGRIRIGSITKKNAKGKEFNVSISPSNVYITELNLEDKVRAARLRLKQQPKAEAQKAEAEPAGDKSAQQPEPNVAGREDSAAKRAIAVASKA